MTENTQTNSAEYIPALKKIRKRRLYLWFVILAYLPAMMVALESPDYKTWVTVVFVTWIVFLIFTVALACLARCPRCGECFHTHGPTFLPFRRCLHCALHVNADKRAPEEDPPNAKYTNKK